MEDVFEVIIRTIIAFFTMFVYSRILGKTAISQLTFFDYITGITIGSIAATLTIDLNNRALSQWVGLTAWIILVLAFEFTAIKNRKLIKIFDGEATVVIHNGKILEANMAKMRYRIADLTKQLRNKGVFSVSEVEFAVLETNGQLSVLKKSQHLPLTPNDINMPTEYKGLSIELVENGSVIQQNLKDLGQTEKWLYQELEKKGITNIKDVVFASLETDGTIYVDIKRDKLQDPIDISDYKGPY